MQRSHLAFFKIQSIPVTEFIVCSMGRCIGHKHAFEPMLELVNEKKLFYLLVCVYTNPLLPGLAPIEPTETIFNFGRFYAKIITHISKPTENSFSVCH